jgi:hypothetical protein
MQNATLIALAALIDLCVQEMDAIRNYIAWIDAGRPVESDDADDQIVVPTALQGVMTGAEHDAAERSLTDLDAHHGRLVARYCELDQQTAA